MNKPSLNALVSTRFEKFFDSRVKNCPDKFKIVNWDSFEVTCKNTRATFTHCISFTGPLRCETLYIADCDYVNILKPVSHIS